MFGGGTRVALSPREKQGGRAAQIVLDTLLGTTAAETGHPGYDILGGLDRYLGGVQALPGRYAREFSNPMLGRAASVSERLGQAAESLWPSVERATKGGYQQAQQGLGTIDVLVGSGMRMPGQRGAPTARQLFTPIDTGDLADAIRRSVARTFSEDVLPQVAARFAASNAILGSPLLQEAARQGRSLAERVAPVISQAQLEARRANLATQAGLSQALLGALSSEYGTQMEGARARALAPSGEERALSSLLEGYNAFRGALQDILRGVNLESALQSKDIATRLGLEESGLQAQRLPYDILLQMATGLPGGMMATSRGTPDWLQGLGSAGAAALGLGLMLGGL